MQIIRALTSMLPSVTAALLVLSFEPARASDAGAHATGRLIVQLREDQSQGAGLAALQGDVKRTDSIDHSRWAADNGLQPLRVLSRQSHLMTVSASNRHSLSPRMPASSLKVMAQRLIMTPEVVSASLEYKRYALLEPNDPLYRGEATDPGVQSYLYTGDYSLLAPGAWDITTGSENAVIAIVDTGVVADHPELRHRSVPAVGYDFVSADLPGDFTSANDGDGRDADPADPGDHCFTGASSWHGTGVASVAAANSNNAVGLAGVDWHARLLHARALGRCGGTDADIIDAIRWSAGLQVTGLPLNDTPATVINLSIGGPTECTPAWQNVIDELNGLDIPLVIAAGNEATNALRSSPANCANVITVGSNTPAGDIDSGFSNYGLKVTVSAPGRDILMATNDGVEGVDVLGHNYKRETGSSFSAALVSGAISLMQSLNAELTPAAVRAILQQSVTAFSTTDDCGTYYCGGGILSLVRAMQVTRDGTYDEQINTEAQVVASQLSTLGSTGSVTGTLDGYRDIRYYQIDVEHVGTMVLRSQSEGDLFGYLLNDKFSVLALDDDSDSALNFRIAQQVEPGTYYLAVERAIDRRTDGEIAYSLTADLTTDQPDPFTFEPIDNVSINSPVLSSAVEISGLSEPAIISVEGGFYSINGDDYTSDQGLIDNGDRVTVSVYSAATINSSTSLTLTIGGYSTDFTVTTGEQTTTPSTPPTDNAASGSANRGSGQFDPLLLMLLLLAYATLANRSVSASGR